MLQNIYSWKIQTSNIHFKATKLNCKAQENNEKKPFF